MGLPLKFFMTENQEGSILLKTHMIPMSLLFRLLLIHFKFSVFQFIIFFPLSEQTIDKCVQRKYTKDVAD